MEEIVDDGVAKEEGAERRSAVLSLAEKLADLDTAQVFLRGVEERKVEDKVDRKQLDAIIAEVKDQRKTLTQLEALVCEMMANFCAQNKLKCRKCPFTTPAPQMTPEVKPKTTTKPLPATTAAPKPETTKEAPHPVTKPPKPQERPTTEVSPTKGVTKKEKPTTMAMTTAMPHTTTSTAPKPDPKGDCKKPDSPPNGHTDTKWTTLNSHAVIICNPGYDLIGMKNMQCTALWNAQKNDFDYSWAPPLSVVCKPNGKPIVPATTKKTTTTTTTKTTTTTTTTKKAAPAKQKITKAPAVTKAPPAKKKAKKEKTKKQEKALRAFVGEEEKVEERRRVVLDERARSFVEEEARVDDLVNDFVADEDDVTLDKRNYFTPHRNEDDIPWECKQNPDVDCCLHHSYYYDTYYGECRGYWYSKTSVNQFSTMHQCQQRCMVENESYYPG